MIFNSRIVIVAAHPDDLEMGMGQFLMQLLQEQRGNSVSCCIVTDGSAAGNSEVRRNEQGAMIAFLKRFAPTTFEGLHPASFAFKDTELAPTKTLISYLEGVCRDRDLVFTHFPEDTHQDHRALGVAIRPACRLTRNVMFFQSYSALDFQPSVFFDFTREEMESDVGKLKLLSFHKSQIDRYAGTQQDVIADMYSLAAYNGFLYKSAKRCAEGFVPWKLDLSERRLDSNVDLLPERFRPSWHPAFLAKPGFASGVDEQNL